MSYRLQANTSNKKGKKHHQKLEVAQKKIYQVEEFFKILSI